MVSSLSFFVVVCAFLGLLLLPASVLALTESFNLNAFPTGGPFPLLSSTGTAASQCQAGSGCPGTNQCTVPFAKDVPTTGTFVNCGTGTYSTLAVIGSLGDILSLSVPTTGNGHDCVWQVVAVGASPTTIITLQDISGGSCTNPILLGSNSVQVNLVEVIGTTGDAQTITLTPGGGGVITCLGLNVFPVGTTACSETTVTGNLNYDITAISLSSTFHTFTLSGGTGHATFSARLENTNVVGDPQFVGLKGQSYQVHGIDGAVYNLISDTDFQLNSQFTFLGSARPCPIIPSTGLKASACWSHPGSYLGSIGLVTADGNRLLIKSGDAKKGFASVQLNGKDVAIGTNGSSFSFISSHEMILTSAQFIVKLENIDSFVNLVSVSLRSWSPVLSSQMKAHGLLGQTWRNVRYNGSIPQIQGEVDDYAILDGDIFGEDFIYNQFSLAGQ